MTCIRMVQLLPTRGWDSAYPPRRPTDKEEVSILLWRLLAQASWAEAGVDRSQGFIKAQIRNQKGERNQDAGSKAKGNGPEWC